MNIADYEANTNELHEKFEAALAHLEQESEDKDAEIEAANREIEGFGQRIYELEEENERIIEESKRLREDEIMERERLEALSNALKEVSIPCSFNLSTGASIIPESCGPQVAPGGAHQLHRRQDPRA